MDSPHGHLMQVCAMFKSVTKKLIRTSFMDGVGPNMVAAVSPRLVVGS